MKHKLGNFCILLGTALVLAALVLFLFNRREEQSASESSGVILPQIVEEILSGQADDAETEILGQIDVIAREMTITQIDGYGYIGFLSIPALELELPVMAELDYTRLKIAPCRYYGSTWTDDLVIAAHNYYSHFGQLSALSVGDAVIFTDMDGNVSSYEVVNLDILSPTAVGEMTAGEYDLTLFTCTYGGQNRVTVFCDREKSE